MNLIVAVDANWGIGYKNDLLVSIPSDKRFFRFETMHKVVVMGRRTLESFPGGKPLKDRTNIVITKNKNYHCCDTVLVHSIEEALEAVKKYPSEEVYVIGGGMIYEALLPYCDRAFVTKVDYKYTADTYFPNLDKMPEWKMTEESEEQTYYDLTYTFCKYERIV